MADLSLPVVILPLENRAEARFLGGDENERDKSSDIALQFRLENFIYQGV